MVEMLGMASVPLLFFYFFYYPPSFSVLGPLTRQWASTLDAALLCSTRAGSDLGLVSSYTYACLVGAVNMFRAVNTLHGLEPCMYETKTLYILKRSHRI